MKRWLVTITAMIIAGCTTTPRPGTADAWMARLAAHCGKAFEGRIVTTDPADADFAGKRLVMHVRTCDDEVIRVPFHVGDDRSRTWVISRTDKGIRLKHDHRHKDGTSDVLTMYGGDTAGPGTVVRQEFPADAQSIAMFTAQERSVSNTNVWAVEVGETVFAYELRRPPGPSQRFFRVEFDLSRPVPPPPAPWGN